MQIAPLQLLLILFAIFAFSRTALRFKDKRLTTHEFIFWSFLWILLIVLAALPSLVISLANMFGVETSLFFVIIPSITLLFYLVFRIYVRIERQEEDITKLTRELAIQKKK